MSVILSSICILKRTRTLLQEEAKTNTSYAQALRVFHKEELEYLTARSKYERAQADLQVRPTELHMFHLLLNSNALSNH